MTSTHGNRQKHASRNPLQRALIANFHRQVAELVVERAPREILEIGCGEGYVLAALRAAGVRCPMHGIDLSSDAVAEARRNVSDATFEVASADSLLHGDTRYDLVLMLEVLEHVGDPVRVLSLSKRSSKRHVVLSVPWEPFFRGLNFLRGRHMPALGNDPDHIHHWGRREFVAFVGRQLTVRSAPATFPWTLVAAELPPAERT